MEPKSSIPLSQIPATCPYFKPARFSPYPTPHFMQIHLNIILPSTPGSPRWSLSLKFSAKTLYTPFLPYMLHASPISSPRLDHQTIFGEQCKSLSSSLCSFLHSSVTSSLLGPNILLNTLFSNTLSLSYSLNVTTNFTPTQNNRQNYISVYFNLYIFL